MLPEHAALSLRETQRELARALRAESMSRPGVFADVPPLAAADRVAVYRNNTRHFHRTALALTFPVVLRRVGEEYFRQLAHEYREAHPSRSGDLHWFGAAFPGWLAARLQDSEYAWLADLARLEWACEEAAAAGTEPAASLDVLRPLPPEALEGARLRLQPSLRLVVSDWPVWSVWQANQGEDAGAPVDLATGPQHCACACAEDRVVVYRLAAEDHAVLAALHDGATLGGAIAQAGSSPDVLGRVLGWTFGAGLVVAVSPSARV